MLMVPCNVLSHDRSPDANLIVVSISRIAGDSEVLQQVNTVVFIISTQSSFQESFPVIVIPVEDGNGLVRSFVRSLLKD